MVLLVSAIITHVMYTSIIRLRAPPVALFTFSAPTELRVNETITFDASTSSDPDGSIISFEWNFDDGATVTETDPVTFHAYTASGNYTVTLTVTDDDGFTDTKSTLLKILPLLPQGLATYVQTWQYPFGGVLKGIIEDPQSGHVMEVHKFFFLDSMNNVVEFLPDYNLFRKWDIPTRDSGAWFGISIMNLRRVFFTQPNANKIGELNEPEDTFTEWVVPNSFYGESKPYGIVVGGRPGPVYFTDIAGSRIGRLQPPQDAFTMWLLPSERRPSGITITQGKIYFLENGNRIGQLNPSTNTITEWTVPDSFGPWSHYIVASQGFLFVTSDSGNNIGRFDPTTNLFVQWFVPSANGKPKGILVDPLDPSLRAYFVESGSGKIGLLDTLSNGTEMLLPFITLQLNRTTTISTRVTTNATPTEVKVPPTTTTVYGETNGAFMEWHLPVPEGGLEALAPSTFRVLFTHNSGIVGRFQTIVKTITEFLLPSDSLPAKLSFRQPTPTEILFTESDNKIGRLNVAENTITEWILPSTGARPFEFAPRYGLAFGDVTFFTEEGANKIASFDPNTNILKEWIVPTSDSMPHGIAFSGASLYFAEFGANKIGRLDPFTNTITEWSIPTTTSGTSHVELWSRYLAFTETFANKIGLLDPMSNTFIELAIPTPNSYPTELTGSESGHLYFVESRSNQIGSLAKYSYGYVFKEWTISTTNLTSMHRQVRNVFFLDSANNKIGFFDPSLDTSASEETVEPSVVEVTPTTTLVTPIENTLTPQVRPVTVTWITAIGEVSNGLIKWVIPTSDSLPLGIVNTDGSGVFFTENNKNKIGRLSGNWF